MLAIYSFCDFVAPPPVITEQATVQMKFFASFHWSAEMKTNTVTVCEGLGNKNNN